MQFRDVKSLLSLALKPNMLSVETVVSTGTNVMRNAIRQRNFLDVMVPLRTPMAWVTAVCIALVIGALV